MKNLFSYKSSMNGRYLSVITISEFLKHFLINYLIE